MSFVKNSAYLTIANLFLLVAAYFLNVWVGRFLGPADFGRYLAIIGVFAIMNVVLTSGTSKAIAKVIAEDKKFASPITAGLLRWGLPLLLLVSAIFYFFIAELIANLLNDPSLLFNIRLLTPIIPIFGIGSMYAGYFIGREQFGLQTIKLIVIAISKIVLVVILTSYFFVAGALASIPLFGLAGILFSLIFIRANPLNKVAKETKEKIGRIMGFLIPMTGFAFLMMFFTQLGVFIIKAGLGDDALTGYFGAAKSTMQIPISIFSAVSVVLLTTVSKSYANKPIKETRTNIKEILRYILIMLTPSILFITATSVPAIRLIYGSDYVGAGTALAILSLGIGLLIFINLLVMILNAIGKPSFTLIIASLMMAIHFVLGNLLLSRGIEGVAISLVVANVVGLLLGLIYIYKKLGNVVDIKSFAKVLILTALLSFALSKVNIPNSVILLIAWFFAGIIYLAALFVLKELTMKDINYIKAIVKSKQK
ncbi:hypothetical protein CMO88_04175 [Candidatus Woesearchaeota archaeon]|nr:hypothetical protein [Candidatus Woesearchaeota archaeon]|tara:strand:- start:13339 stop:14781 length:1443 start_codon:yes stop_codon:yes gene_type:complete